jgi:hypothetical protein
MFAIRRLVTGLKICAVFIADNERALNRPRNPATGWHSDPKYESMKKLETSGYQTVSERPISFGLAERQRAAEAARQAEIENPSVRKLLPELRSSAEDAVNNLIKAFSKLTKRHEDIIQLEAALKLANDEIIQLNDDRTSDPERLALKNTKARNGARAKADQLQTARDLEATVLSSMPIPKTCLELERWRHGLQQAIASFARGEIRRMAEGATGEMTETILTDLVAKDPRVAELSQNSRLHRNAKSSFQQAADAIDLLRAKFQFLQANDEKISLLIDGGFQAKFCSWEWQRIWN